MELTQQITFPLTDIDERNSNHEGIYCFLKNGEEIMYVGETGNFGNRYQQHYLAVEKESNRLAEKVREEVRKGSIIEMKVLRDITEEQKNSFGGYFGWTKGICVYPPQTERERCALESAYIALLQPAWNEQGITRPYPLPTNEWLKERKERSKKYYEEKKNRLGE